MPFPEWVELGNAYRPALEALESIQSNNLRLLHEESCERLRFHEFASINRCLGRFELATSLFAELAEHQPEFAQTCFRAALPALVRTRSFAPARRFVSSPNEQLDNHLIMYGPPPDCKRFEVERRDSLRKCIRPLSGVILRALDDDPGVSVLINPSVTREALSTSGFPSRRLTVLSSPSLLRRP
jgi:hypothetical protein